MNKTYLFVAILLVATGVFFVLKNVGPKSEYTETKEDTQKIVMDPLNMTYNIEGELFTMVNGVAEKEAPENIATTNTLTIFGAPVAGDLDQDGDQDSAVWLINDSGGTGKFHYAVLIMDNNGTFTQTNAMFLGDRIAPQTLEIRDGRAVYNFAERKPDEPFSAEPSVAKSVWVNYDKNTSQIGEWVKDFEGEADPAKMTLGMKTWEWQYVLYSDDTKITPRDPKKFTISFKNDGTFSASTDCNGIGGNYSTDGNKISFSDMLGTLMYCEGAQEGDFKKVLENASTYFFTSKGELVIEIKYDSGSAIFK